MPYTVGKLRADSLNPDSLLVANLTGAWLPWSPTITASGTAFSMGNATVNGAYIQSGKFVSCRVRIVMGGSTTFGTGTYSLSLPVTPVAGLQSVGSAYFRDASAGSTGHFPGICVIDAALSTTVMTMFNVNQSIGATFPFTWVSTDHLSVAITYEAA